MDVTQNYFQVFNIPSAFVIDTSELATRYRELQKGVHPDKFANASVREKRMAVQYAAFINEAFNVLATPLSRAQYLLELNGVALDQQGTADIDTLFLMEQVEIREALADIKSQQGSEDELKQIRQQVQLQSQNLIDVYSDSISKGDLLAAKKAVLKLQFMDKITQDIDNLEEELFD